MANAGRNEMDPNEKYYCFTIDTSDDEARRKFKERHGYEPERIIRTQKPPMVWAGPVTK